MSIGIWQVVLILVIVLIIFGAGRLPNVMGDVAKGVRNFKAGLKDGETPQEENTRQINTETAAPSAHAQTSAARNDETAKT